MTQRISINYSLRVEELPDKIRTMIESIDNDLKSTTPQWELGCSTMSPDMLTEIGRMQSYLSDIQHRLSDVENIISSYLHHVSAPPAPTNNAETHPELAAMYDQLKDLTRSLNLGDGENEVSDQKSQI